MIRVLIVEDELLIANYLKEVLVLEGFDVVDIARDQTGCLEKFANLRPHLVCMDIRLKGDDNGIETARKLRSIDDSFVLIYLTAHGDRALVEEAQQTHPSGYLVKPVSDKTIIATITTAITGAQLSDASCHSASQYTVVPTSGGEAIGIDVTSGTVRVGGEELNFTPQEMKLIVLLLERHGNVVPFASLRDRVWGDCVVGDASLKTLVWRIRNKLSGQDLIETVAGFGYAIWGEVTIIKN